MLRWRNGRLKDVGVLDRALKLCPGYQLVNTLVYLTPKWLVVHRHTNKKFENLSKNEKRKKEKK